jgi:hypothetical protein
LLALPDIDFTREHAQEISQFQDRIVDECDRVALDPPSRQIVATLIRIWWPTMTDKRLIS